MTANPTHSATVAPPPPPPLLSTAPWSTFPMPPPLQDVVTADAPLPGCCNTAAAPPAAAAPTQAGMPVKHYTPRLHSGRGKKATAPPDKCALTSLGPATRHTRDTINRFQEELTAELHPGITQRVKLLEKLNTLREAIAWDVGNVMTETFNAGINHGALRERNQNGTLDLIHQAAALKTLQQAFADLQQHCVLLEAKLTELDQRASPPSELMIDTDWSEADLQTWLERFLAEETIEPPPVTRQNTPGITTFGNIAVA